MDKHELSFDKLDKVSGGMARLPTGGPKGPLIPPTTGPTIPVEKPLVVTCI